MNPEEITAQLQTSLASLSLPDLTFDFILSVVIILVLVLIQRALLRLLNRQELEPAARYRWSKIVSYSVTAVGVLLVGSLWWEGMAGLATIIGLVLAGLAVALQQPITSLAGWAYILWRKPFDLGHRITIANVRGDVADIGPFVVSLLEVGDARSANTRQVTGKVIHVPNSFVFSHTVTNESIGFQFIWHEIPVVVTFESDWGKAKHILTDIAHRHGGRLVDEADEQLKAAAARFLIGSGNPEPTVFTRVIDFGVELTIRFVSEIRRTRQMEQAIWEDVLKAFAAEPAIDFAYPTTRFYDNRAEGKPEAGGPPGQETSKPAEA